MKLYLAGPMRGYPRYNFDAFTDAAAKLRCRGYAVLSPAEHDLEGGFDPELPLEEQDFSLADAFKWDLDCILSGDAVVLLPGWEKSSGVAGELAVARAVGRMVYEYSYAHKGGVRLVWLPADEQIARAAQAAGWTIDSLEQEDNRWPDHLGRSFDFQVAAIPHPASTSTGEVRVTDPNTGGQKGAKPAQLGALDPASLLVLAEVAGMGTHKYERYNFLRGYAWSLSFDAMMRHALAFWSGENVDPESGLPHMAHVSWHGLTMVAFLLHGLGTDDRPAVTSGEQREVSE